jgi:hypothetical protein
MRIEKKLKFSVAGNQYRRDHGVGGREVEVADPGQTEQKAGFIGSAEGSQVTGRRDRGEASIRNTQRQTL